MLFLHRPLWLEHFPLVRGGFDNCSCPWEFIVSSIFDDISMIYFFYMQHSRFRILRTDGSIFRIRRFVHHFRPMVLFLLCACVSGIMPYLLPRGGAPYSSCISLETSLILPIIIGICFAFALLQPRGTIYYPATTLSHGRVSLAGGNLVLLIK